MANSDSKGDYYFNGLMIADGWVSKMEKQETQIGLLQKGDSGKNILNKFVEHFDLNTEPFQKVVKGKKYWRVQVYSDSWAKFWRERGVHPNKTDFAFAPKKLENSSDFWRGVIDGDGAIDYQKGCPRVRLKMGSEAIVKQFASYVSFLPTNASVRKVKEGWSLGLHGNYVRALLELLYRNSQPFTLNRKHKKYKQYAKL